MNAGAAVLQHQDYVRGVAWQLLGSDTPAYVVDDIVQDITVRLLRCLDGLRHQAAIKGYIWRTAKHVIVSWMRRERRYVLALSSEDEIMQHEPAFTPHFDEVLDVRTAAKTAAEAILNLPERQRAVMIMAAGGYSMAEIAQRLNIPEGTVKSNLYAARKSVRAAIE
jgi:RNA polymerase sigma-70 factor (ECF subfamily)